LARELIYEKSWEGFLQSPIIGHGWIGESVHPKELLPIGSHSTIYGLLYTGGLPTLAAFIVALSLTLSAIVWRYVSVGAQDRRRTGILMGIGVTLCLVMNCRYEALYSLTLPCLFLFTWIGACIGASEIAPFHSPERRDFGVWLRGRVSTTRTPRAIPLGADNRAFKMRDSLEGE
jgi:O-antigen ligase